MPLPLLCLLLAPQDPPVQATPPRQALLFKSGQAYLERAVPIPPGTESMRLRLPEGIHGTTWLGAPAGRLVGARALLASDLVEREVTDLAGALRMAVGKSVVLEVAAGQQTASVGGRVERILEAPFIVPAGGSPELLSPSAVVIDGGQVIPVNRIVGLRFAPGAGELGWKFQAAVQRPVLDVTVGAHPEPWDLSLSSMANGLAWAPSYVLELGAGGRARLVGKAVIVNDLEDLVDTELRLVIGYPNIQFANVRDPLLPEVTLGQFRAMLGQPEMDQQLGVMLQNVAPARAAFGESVSGPAQPLAGEASEDLFIYELGKLSLRRGERAYLPLLEQEVDFQHRFDWELPDKVDRWANFMETPGTEEPPVWHVLRVRNSGAAPWTTAPVLILGELGPLAQSRLDYTPPGAETKVTITQALDLVGQSLEMRADGDRSPREAVILFGGSFERVRVKGSLELVNRSSRSAPMHVIKHLSGDLVSTPEGASVEGKALGLGQINASRTLRWDFELPPGQTWKAQYEYEVLIRR